MLLFYIIMVRHFENLEFLYTRSEVQLFCYNQLITRFLNYLPLHLRYTEIVPLEMDHCNYEYIFYENLKLSLLQEISYQYCPGYAELGEFG